MANVRVGLDTADYESGSKKLDVRDFIFQLEPEQAFGQHNPRLVERIARSGLPADMELKENSVVEFTAPNGGTFAGFLRELDATHALFDFNHPMAGKTIRFEVKIIGIM